MKEVNAFFPKLWKCVKTNPPKESGRYWCFVKEQNDLGISFYQWNCSYNVDSGFTKPDNNTIEITHWTELMPNPDQIDDNKLLKNGLKLKHIN